MSAQPSSAGRARPSGTAQVWAALLTVYIVWGSSYLAIRLAVNPAHGGAVPPFLLTGIRYVVAGVVMFAFTARLPSPDGRPDPLGPRQWASTAVVGITLLVGGAGLVSLGERHITSGAAALVVATVPIWAAVLAATFGIERLDLRTALGILTGLVGVGALVAGQGSGRVEPAGVGIVLLSSLSWAGGSVYSRGAPLPSRALTATAMEMICGGAGALVTSAASGELATFHPSKVGLSAWAGVAYLTFAGSLLAYTAYIWLLDHAAMSLATTYAYVNPLMAVLLGAAALSEPLTWRAGLSAVFILSGVALIITQAGRSSAGKAALPPGASREEPISPR
ncbi:MAG TPA: EamA family transporter [Acidimicrobiales bacterium]|nr:EamA family transporter [Acidimicrobiales bacterium]